MNNLPNHTCRSGGPTLFTQITLAISLMLLLNGCFGCGGDDQELGIAVNGRSDLPAEGEGIYGVQVRTDCAMDYCVPVGETVQLKALGCGHCAGAKWTITQPDGTNFKTGRGDTMSFYTTVPGTWLAVLEWEDQNPVKHFIIARPKEEVELAAADPPVSELPEVTRREVRTGTSLSESKPAEKQGILDPVSPSASVPVSKNARSEPERKDLPDLDIKGVALELDGRQAFLNGLADGQYLVKYRLDGKDYQRDIEVKQGAAMWPLILVSTRRQQVELYAVQRKVDQMERSTLVRATFGADAPAVASTPSVPKEESKPAPVKQAAAMKGKSERIGPKQPAGMPTCASWVTKAELTLTASGPCELRDAWLWTDQDGTVKMHVKTKDGSISKRLPAGYNQVTLTNLDIVLAQGETATLVLESVGCRMANLTTCSPAINQSSILKIGNLSGVSVLSDMLIRY